MRIPLVLWLLLLMSLCVLVSPWVQARLGQPWAVYTSSMPTITEPSSSAPMPVVSAGSIIDDPAASIETLNGAYHPMRKHLGPWWSGLQVRFVFVEPRGMIQDTHTRGLIGNWHSISANTMASDLTLIPPDHRGLDYPIEALEVDYYTQSYYIPSEWEFDYLIARLNGAQNYWRQLNALNILSTVMVLWVLIRIINWAQRRRGRRHMRRKSTILLVNFSAAALLIYLGWHLQTSDHLVSFTGPTATTPVPSITGDWMDGEDWVELVSDPMVGDRLIELMAPLAEQSPPHHVLGYQYTRETDAEFTQYTADMFGQLPLISYSNQHFYTLDQYGQAQPTDRPGGYMNGIQIRWPITSEWMSISWGTQRSLLGLMIVPTHLVLFGAVLWSLLQYAKLIGRRFAYRTQKKRVKKDQCIFCGYPLSPEALSARSGGSGS
ncbi:MAG: hypothetical protein KDA29_14055 [Phycisphaerales bacterium]|nr:hypothetical protein [Phycisphaerales bacterium]